MLDAAIEAGADDVSSSENGHEIYASPETFREVAKGREAKFGEPRKAALTWKPHNTVPVDDETGEKLLKLIDLLNEHDDVQNVFANFEVSDALMTKMGGEFAPRPGHAPAPFTGYDGLFLFRSPCSGVNTWA